MIFKEAIKNEYLNEVLESIHEETYKLDKVYFSSQEFYNSIEFFIQVPEDPVVTAQIFNNNFNLYQDYLNYFGYKNKKKPFRRPASFPVFIKFAQYFKRNKN